MNTTKQFSPNSAFKSILHDSSISAHERLRRYTAACGGDLKSLALALNYHPWHIYQVLRGYHESMTLKRNIAKFLDVDVAVLWPEAVEKDKDAA